MPMGGPALLYSSPCGISFSVRCQSSSSSSTAESNSYVRTIFQATSTAHLRLGCRRRGIRGRDRGEQEGVELGRKLGKGKGAVQ